MKNIKSSIIYILIVSLISQSVAFAQKPDNPAPPPPGTPSPPPNPEQGGSGATGSTGTNTDNSDDQQVNGNAVVTGGGARMPVTGDAVAASAATGLQNPLPVTQGCPFLPANQDAAALVDRTQSLLTSLIRQNEQNRNGVCAPAAQGLTNARAAFESLQTRSRQNLATADANGASCGNYEDVLRAKYSVAIALVTGEAASFNTNDRENDYFSYCRSNNRLNEECVTERFTQELGRTGDRCRSAGFADTQNYRTDTRQNIANISGAINSLITDASSCGGPAGQSIMQSALQQATSAASLASGAGLPGLGISLLGGVLSAIANRFFNRNSPQRFLKTLEDNEARPGIQCLFYDLQKTVLRCESPATVDRQESPAATPEVLSCVEGINRLSEFTNFAENFTASVRTPAGASDTAIPEFSMTQFNLASAQINNAQEELRTAADTLRQGTAGDRILGENLDSFLAEHRIITNTPIGAQEQALARAYDALPTRERATRIQNLMRRFSNTGDEPINLVETFEAYRRLRANRDTTFAASLRHIEATRAVSAADSQARRAESAQAQDSFSLASVRDAVKAMVGTTQNQFTSRIARLRREWDQSSQSTTDPANKMSLLTELFTLCMTTQGMSYFNAERGDLFTQANAQSEYTSACSVFECTDSQNEPSLFVPFNPTDNRLGNGDPADRFRQYQCAMNRSFDERYERLRNNINLNGQICGADSSRRPAGR